MLSRFRALFLAALCAGLVAGTAMGVGHVLVAAPLIAQAEQLESPGRGGGQGDGQSDGHGHDAVVSPLVPRAAQTLAADILAGIGFALLLAAAMSARGGASSVGEGILWGGAGFATFVLAPSLGLPPELPGSEAAPLFTRQLWWLGTVAATGLGLALLAFRRPIPLKLAGVALILLPHLLGAPRPDGAGGSAPAGLEDVFLLSSLATLLMFWLLLGLACAWCLRRFPPPFGAVRLTI